MFVDGDKVRTRRISPTQYARVMGLDADYELPTNHNAVYNLIGDGVCPPVIRFLAQHIIEPVLAASLAMAAERWAKYDRNCATSATGRMAWLRRIHHPNSPPPRGA